MPSSYTYIALTVSITALLIVACSDEQTSSTTSNGTGGVTTAENTTTTPSTTTPSATTGETSSTTGETSSTTGETSSTTGTETSEQDVGTPDIDEGDTSLDTDEDTAPDVMEDTAPDAPNPDEPVDITDRIFESRVGSCSAYVGTYTALVRDVMRANDLEASVEITADATHCTIASNSIPNHDFNEMGRFAHATSYVEESFRVPIQPTFAEDVTFLTLQIDNAIFLNGAKLDRMAAACYGIGNAPLGEERIGCNQNNVPWRYDPMFSGNGFGTDEHNAHTQPDGAYHYHGDPRAMYDDTGSVASGVIGFAADGFPIFGPFFNDNGTIRRARSGYALKPGARESMPREGAFPGGDYDGTFNEDYVWSEGVGDLDICNGMTVDGQYGYYITDTFPWVMNCFRGTPDPSFNKRQ